MYAIITHGDTQGGGRDDIRVCTEQEALAYVPDGWSRAVKIQLDEINTVTYAEMLADIVRLTTLAMQEQITDRECVSEIIGTLDGVKSEYV